MRRYSEIYKEYDQLAESYKNELNDNISLRMIELDNELVTLKNKYPYGGVCEDCGKETTEFCHDHRCLDCCIEHNKLFDINLEE